jgi:hypothetical protein
LGHKSAMYRKAQLAWRLAIPELIDRCAPGGWFKILLH